MWIELEDEIFSDIENIIDPFDKKIRALNTLFDSMWRCQHIVFANYVQLMKVAKHPLISQTNQKFVKWIIEKYIYVYECSEMIKCKIYVSAYEIDTYRCEKGYHISIYRCTDIKEAKLLTENETDGNFFKRIYNYIANEKNTDAIYNIKFENDAFHGSNASSKIQEIVKEDRIMLCIVDSDKDYKDGKSGSTFNSANANVRKCNKKHIIMLYELNAREKENLISPEMYLCFIEDKLLELINNEFKDENILLYFDIKDGITYKRKLVPDIRWNNYYNELINKCEEKNICNLEAKVEKDIYIHGIGGSICEKVSSVFLSIDEGETMENIIKASLDKDKKNKIIKNKKMIINNIPPCIKKEWNALYELLFTWGCCLSEKKLPFYQIK